MQQLLSLFVMAMTAAVTLVVMVAAMMVVITAVTLPMVVAAGIGVKAEHTGSKGLHSLIGITADAAEDLDVRILQGKPGAAANAAADEYIHALRLQKACQGAVTAAVGIHHTGGRHLAVLHDIELELSRVAEMLKNITALIGHCDDHVIFLLFFFYYITRCQ